MSSRLHRPFEHLGFDAVFWLVVGAFVLAVAWGVWSQVGDAMAASWRLRKDQWSCTSSHTLTFSEVSRLGHVHTSRRELCDQYTRAPDKAAGVRIDPR